MGSVVIRIVYSLRQIKTSNIQLCVRRREMVVSIDYTTIRGLEHILIYDGIISICRTHLEALRSRSPIRAYLNIQIAPPTPKNWTHTTGARSWKYHHSRTIAQHSLSMQKRRSRCVRFKNRSGTNYFCGANLFDDL